MSDAADCVPRICRNYVYPSLSGTWSYPPVFSKRWHRRQEARRQAALLSTSKIPNVSFRDTSSPCIQIPLTINSVCWPAGSLAIRLSSTVGACSTTRGHVPYRARRTDARLMTITYRRRGGGHYHVPPFAFLLFLRFQSATCSARTILITGAGWSPGLRRRDRRL